MSVYILHLNTPLGHARHYVGWASNVDGRVWHHQHGSGSKFTKACVERGITFELARVFNDADRRFERKLKNTNNTAVYCPKCKGDKARDYHPKPVCEHNRIIGDNYGQTCQDCGKQIEGYGYWATFKKCIHRFVDSGGNYKTCIYCELPEYLTE